MMSLSNWLFGKETLPKGETFAALDVGSSKIACLIARTDDEGMPHIVGIGHQLSEGVRSGLISDMEGVQRAIGAAVTAAEQMAGETIDRVTVNISGSQLCSQMAGVELPLNGRDVTDSDIQRILAQGQTLAPEDSQGHMLELIHTLPVHYVLDGQKGIRDPLGMIGHQLNVQLHLVSASFGAVRTLITAIARCHLEVERLVAAPYASGLACLVEDEMELGCTVIDIGAGTTSFASFIEGNLVHTDGISVGGGHITNDLARGLTTSLANAERMKTLFGSAISSSKDERDLIDVPPLGEESSPELVNHLPKSQLSRIIQPRLEEIIELVRAKLNTAGVLETTGHRVVLTGGTSQLPGIRDMAQRLLDKQVRLGKPLRMTRPLPTASIRGNGQIKSGLPDAVSGPAFSTTAGLLGLAMAADFAPANSATLLTQSPLSRLGQWIKQI